MRGMLGSSCYSRCAVLDSFSYLPFAPPPAAVSAVNFHSGFCCFPTEIYSAQICPKMCVCVCVCVWGACSVYRCCIFISVFLCLTLKVASCLKPRCLVLCMRKNVLYMHIRAKFGYYDRNHFISYKDCLSLTILCILLFQLVSPTLVFCRVKRLAGYASNLLSSG